MITPKLPSNELERLKSLYNLELLDTPIDHGFEKITKLAQRVFGTSISAISLVDKDRQWFKSIQGLDAKETDRSVSFCGHTILTPNVMVVSDALKDSRFIDNPLVLGNPKIRFYAGCPIKLSDEIHIGTLCIIDQKPRNFSDKEILCLKDLTIFVEDEISNHVNNYVINHENKLLTQELSKLKRVAAIDSLTKLWNRVAVTRFFENMKSQAIRTSSSFALGIIDMDNFKTINDQYGHGAGDVVLKEIANVLINTVRKMDTVCRWGGDEFIVLLDTEDTYKIKDIFERISNEIKNLKIKYKDHIIKSSATIGVTLFKPGDKADSTESIGIENIIDEADKCLYQGKHAKKNGSIIYCN